MAEVLTRPRSRRSKKPDAHERELKRLKLSVCDDVGFRLFLATYDQPKRRGELIERVVKVAEAEKVRITRLDLAEAGPETNLVGLLRAHLRETDLPPGWRQAVMVTGIEQRLDYSAGRKGLAFLHQANLLRDTLPEAAPVPVVLWLSRVASAALPAEAPDLWHWRAANFDFTGDVAPRLELLRELTTLQSEDEGGLSREQRQARVHLLEDLLGELERKRPPKSKRQAAERAELLAQLAFEALLLGRAAEAIPRIERVLEYARHIEDRGIEATGLVLLGRLCAQLGHQHRAIKHLEKGLAIARKIRDRLVQSSALLNLGNAYAALDEQQRAIEYYNQLLAIAHELGDPRREALASGRLGLAYVTLGEFQRALEPLEQQLAIVREVGSRRGEGAALGSLALAYAGLGEVPHAIRHIEQSLGIARESGDQLLEGNGLFASALFFDQLGERAEAIRRMEEALRIYEQLEDPWRENARTQLAKWRAEGSN